MLSVTTDHLYVRIANDPLSKLNMSLSKVLNVIKYKNAVPFLKRNVRGLCIRIFIGIRIRN